MENRSAQPHILIVDDALSHRKLMDVLLAQEPYLVVAVEDGRAALAYLREHTPDLLILDVEMPQLSGLDVCGRVKSVRRLADVPVLLVSSRSRASVEPQLDWVRADAFLEKPLRMEVFKAKVRELLGTGAVSLRSTGRDRGDVAGSMGDQVAGDPQEGVFVTVR